MLSIGGVIGSTIGVAQRPLFRDRAVDHELFLLTPGAICEQ